MEGIQKGKTAAIMAYILIIGVPIAMSMNTAEDKTEFASFHIRQAVGITITFLSLGLIVNHFDSFMITLPMWISVSVLWSYGFLSAIKESTVPMPLLGGFFQKFFKGIAS